MPDPFFFNGQTHYTPGAFSQVNDSAMAPASPATGNTVCIIGTAQGGQPLTPLIFSNPDNALAVLVGGDLAYITRKAFSVSSAINAPSQVIAVRVDEATQATLALLDSSGSPSINLSSGQWGVGANGTSVRITTGSTIGLQVTLQLNGQTWSQDNIALAPLSVAYSGTQSSATITVTNSTVTLAAPTGTTVGTISLASYTTVQALVNAINAVSGFSATVLSGNGNLATAGILDNVTAKALTTTPAALYANRQAVINWMNSLANSLAVAPVIATAASNATLPPAPISTTYLSGAVTGAAVTGDWTAALSLLQTLDVQHIVVLTSNPAIWAALDAHVQYMSTVAKRERRGYVGPAIGTSVSAVEAIPATINSDRTSVTWPGYYDYDPNGNYVLYAPYFSAALHALGYGGLPVGESMTNKALSIQALETVVRITADSDPLIAAGVTVIGSKPNGFTVLRSVSSWLQDNKYDRVEISCGNATDYTVRSVREAVELNAGSPNSPTALAQMITIAETVLSGLAKPAPNGPGILVGDANSPAYSDIKASITGDVRQLSFTCSPVIPGNFIGVTVGLRPYSGSATSAATGGVSG
jgi:hypothetical protein